MAGFVEIANTVAVLIGTEARITDPNDERVLARTVRALWDLQRRATIRDGEWNFAIKREELAALAGAVPYPYEYAYKMPADALRLLEVLTAGARESYALEGGKILCDTGAPIHIRYLRDVTEPAEWDDAFTDAFAKRLAWQAGRKIAGSAFDEGAAGDDYREALLKAKSVDARENPPLEQEECGWILARYGGASYDPSRLG